MATVLRNLKILEVSSVDRGAGQGVKVVLVKRDADDPFAKAGLTNPERRAADARAPRDRRMTRENEIRSASDDQWDDNDDDGDESMATKSETIRKAQALDGDDKIEFITKAMIDRTMKVADVDAVIKAHVRASMRKDESELRAHARLAGSDPVFNRLVGCRRDALYVNSQ